MWLHRSISTVPTCCTIRSIDSIFNTLCRIALAALTRGSDTCSIRRFALTKSYLGAGCSSLSCPIESTTRVVVCLSRRTSFCTLFISFFLSSPLMCENLDPLRMEQLTMWSTSLMRLLSCLIESTSSSTCSGGSTSVGTYFGGGGSWKGAREPSLPSSVSVSCSHSFRAVRSFSTVWIPRDGLSRSSRSVWLPSARSQFPLPSLWSASSDRLSSGGLSSILRSCLHSAALWS
mmetsp:Transcript_29104/g.71332  ORF Transcript_29104/g.71332 Transcript_29104/m.71332 type:complete len:232 (-) Transcript_29104:157-852(-)